MPKIPMQQMFDQHTPERPNPPRPQPPEPGPKPRKYAVPGSAEMSHRKPLPRGEPFLPTNSLVKWSPR